MSLAMDGEEMASKKEPLDLCRQKESPTEWATGGGQGGLAVGSNDVEPRSGQRC